MITSGVRRTTMGDVAEAAGVPRPTLYKYVATASSFEEAVIETSVAAIMATHDDPEVSNIVATAPNRRIHEVLEGSNQAVAENTAHYLEPMKTSGR